MSLPGNTSATQGRPATDPSRERQQKEIASLKRNLAFLWIVISGGIVLWGIFQRSGPTILIGSVSFIFAIVFVGPLIKEGFANLAKEEAVR